MTQLNRGGIHTEVIISWARKFDWKVVHDTTVTHHDYPISKDKGFVHVVGHKDNRLAGLLPKVQQSRMQLRPCDEIQRPKGLIH